MRRAHRLPLALLAATALAGGAVAQTPQPAARQDLRQLSWPGRTVAATSPAATAAARTDLRRSNLVIPHGGFNAVDRSSPSAPPASAPRRTLTPASAWLRPAPPSPAPVPVRAEAPAPMPAPPPPPPSVRPAATPEYLPDQGSRGQPVPAEIAYSAPPPAPSDVAARTSEQPADPMAPRRDAPIFRLQQPAPQPQPSAEVAAAQDQAAAPRPRYTAEVTNTGERPPQQGARYYSVHRQNGRQPDVLAMPEPTFVDALAVTMTQTPASQDLAEPEPGPTLIRDAQGRTRPVPTASDGDHQ